jgi:hypothetical protein
MKIIIIMISNVTTHILLSETPHLPKLLHAEYVIQNLIISTNIPCQPPTCLHGKNNDCRSEHPGGIFARHGHSVPQLD